MQRIAWLERLAVEREAAGVRPVRAAEHLHQRAFAGAVFADERVDLAGGNLETHAIERHRRPEALGHPVNVQSRHWRAGINNGFTRHSLGSVARSLSPTLSRWERELGQARQSWFLLPLGEGG